MYPPDTYPDYFGDDAFSSNGGVRMELPTLPGLAEAPAELSPEGAFEKHWLKTLAHVLTDEVQELYSAEKLLSEIIPQMTEAASGKILRLICQHQAEQTREHLRRMDQVQQILGLLPDGRTCQTMAGLITGLQETIVENRLGAERDDGLLAAAHKIKHFAVAGYCGARDFAQLLGQESVAALLQKNLDEEYAMEIRLANLREIMNNRAGMQEWR